MNFFLNGSETYVGSFTIQMPLLIGTRSDEHVCMFPRKPQVWI